MEFSSSDNKITPKLNFTTDTSILSNGYRSSATKTTRNGYGYGKIEFIDDTDSVDSSPFLMSKNDPKTFNPNAQELIGLDTCTSLFNKTKSQQEVEAIDVCEQDPAECGMKSCEVFVPCAVLETMDEVVELLTPELNEQEKQLKLDSPLCLKLNETCCIVSNGNEECIELVPISIARVTDDMDLHIKSKGNNGVGNERLNNDDMYNDGVDNCRSPHVPEIEGCALIQHKPIVFAVYFYPCPDNSNGTLIEFQRRSGDVFVFQKFYDGCLEQLAKTMKDLRNCTGTSKYDWWSLPSLDDLNCNGFAHSEPWWDKDCLDLLANLIKDGSQEALDMLGSLCEEMEKHPPLREQVLEHKKLMEQMVTRVLTHQDQCFVRLGLVALYTSLGGEKVDLVKDVLQSYQTLAFIIALLDSASMFVLRHTVRLLALLATICECPWKLNESQKQTLHVTMPRVQKCLLETHNWSAMYATDTFVTQDMFQRIAFHPTT